MQDQREVPRPFLRPAETPDVGGTVNALAVGSPGGLTLPHRPLGVCEGRSLVVTLKILSLVDRRATHPKALS